MITLLLVAASLAVLSTLVVPDQGEGFALDAWTGKLASSAWTCRLYANNFALVHGMTEASLTEAAGGGYAGIALVAANWVTTPGSPSSTAHPQITFTFTGPLTTNPDVFGYYITRADGKLVYAEAFAAKFTPTNNGDNIQVTPTITGASVLSD